LDEQIILTEAHKTTELTLNSIANTLKDLMENNINDINKLQNKIGKQFYWLFILKYNSNNSNNNN